MSLKKKKHILFHALLGQEDVIGVSVSGALSCQQAPGGVSTQ